MIISMKVHATRQEIDEVRDAGGTISATRCTRSKGKSES